MTHITGFKIVTALLILSTAMLGTAIAVAFTGSTPEDPTVPGPGVHPGDPSTLVPGITLGLKGEARKSLLQGGQAFPATNAGFSAYYRAGNGAGGFGLDKNMVDQALFNNPNPTLLRAGVGTLIETGANYTIGSVPILNIDGLTTSVNLYYDDEGWLVAYFPAGQESSRAWQAVGVGIENTTLGAPSSPPLSRTTLLDAINDVLADALFTSPVTPEQLGYYHWQYPTATSFLMIATARGTIGSDLVSFAVPSNYVVQEVSASMWISQIDMPCARLVLDGVNLTGDQCNRSFHHVFPNLSNFNGLAAHTLELNHFNQDKGASGAVVMIVYSPP